ncbi:hypothetical protein FOA52_005498 [Chlamydomonas sp. UWO 241]|nr:hypothetical protein FOA52_005498 [Chlamydomonas sp. UWO 241]
MGCKGDPPRLVYVMGLAPAFRPGDSPVVGCWSADGVPWPSSPPFARAPRRRLFLVAAYGGHDLVRRLAGAPKVRVRQKLEDGTAAPVRRLRVTRVRAAVHRSPAAGGAEGGDVNGTVFRPASPGGSSYGAGVGDGDDELLNEYSDGANVPALDDDMPQAPAAGKRGRNRDGSVASADGDEDHRHLPPRGEGAARAPAVGGLRAGADPYHAPFAGIQAYSSQDGGGEPAGVPSEVSPLGCSDHRPVVLHLIPAAPEKVGPGLHRLRVRFLDDPALREEFAAWLATEEVAAPAADADLLDWWPSFKRQLSCEAARLSTVRAAPAAAAATALRAAAAELRDAMDAAARARGATEPAALARVLAASAAHSATLRSTALLAEQRARYMWLRDGERPSPLLSKLMRPPKASRQVGALRARGGGLTTDGYVMAGTMARLFSGISAALPPDPQALDAVLAAVRSQTRIQPELATAAGAPDVSVAETGDPTEPTNYRPITLLSTDYRVMTKTLAARLAQVLTTVVGPHQTAFLPGRLITDNVLFMYLLPHLLASNRDAGDGDTAAVAAFLVFRKAYDTVSHPFLYEVMEAMGAGEGLIRWTRAILTGTTASAMVNGFTSAAQPYHAGVRQGCPVVPALFLFAAEALVRHLRGCPSDLLQSWSHRDHDDDDRLTPEVAAMYAVLPAEWKADATCRLPPVLTPQPTLPVTLPSAEEAAAARAAAACVGWRSGPSGKHPLGSVIPLVGPGGLTVRDATGIQLRGLNGARRACHTDIVTAALMLSGTPVQTASPTVVGAGRASVAVALRKVWQLGCDNTLKETLWRVTLNGVPGAGGGGIILKDPCPCGWHPTHGPRPDLMWRSHYFWECRVATAVVGAVRDGLEAKGVPAGALNCRHIWLLQPPAAAVYADVWRVVCMATFDAMAYGRCLLWALHLAADAAPPPDDQTLITDFFPARMAGPALPDKADHAGRAAVARFWTSLQEFASLDLVPPTWAAADGPPPYHPFIGVVRVGDQPRLCLHAPVDPP